MQHKSMYPRTQYILCNSMILYPCNNTEIANNKISRTKLLQQGVCAELIRKRAPVISASGSPSSHQLNVNQRVYVSRAGHTRLCAIHATSRDRRPIREEYSGGYYAHYFRSRFANLVIVIRRKYCFYVLQLYVW